MTCDWVDSWSKVPKAFHVPNTTSNCSLFISSASYLSSPCLGVRRDAQGPRNRGTRTEALSLLGLFLPFSVINLFLLLHSVFLFKIVLSPNLNAHLLGKKPHQYLWSTLWHCYLLLKITLECILIFYCCRCCCYCHHRSDGLLWGREGGHLIATPSAVVRRNWRFRSAVQGSCDDHRVRTRRLILVRFWYFIAFNLTLMNFQLLIYFHWIERSKNLIICQ